MSKLAHSNERSMLQIDIRSAIEEGNQDLVLTAFDALKAENERLRELLNRALPAVDRLASAEAQGNKALPQTRPITHWQDVWTDASAALAKAGE